MMCGKTDKKSSCNKKKNLRHNCGSVHQMGEFVNYKIYINIGNVINVIAYQYSIFNDE